MQTDRRGRTHPLPLSTTAAKLVSKYRVRVCSLSVVQQVLPKIRKESTQARSVSCFAHMPACLSAYMSACLPACLYACLT